jgi:hypothetical protein
MYFAYYLCTVYLPAVSLASPTKEALHPQLGCRMGSPFRCSPARCVASSARSSRHSPRPTPAPRLRCSLARPALACATPTLTLTRPTLADAASHLLEAEDGSEARHGATTSVAEHDARRNRRRAMGEEDGRPLIRKGQRRS